jgi:hypothetical protein
MEAPAIRLDKSDNIADVSRRFHLFCTSGGTLVSRSASALILLLR